MSVKQNNGACDSQLAGYFHFGTAHGVGLGHAAKAIPEQTAGLEQEVQGGALAGLPALLSFWARLALLDGNLQYLLAMHALA